MQIKNLANDSNPDYLANTDAVNGLRPSSSLLVMLSSIRTTTLELSLADITTLVLSSWMQTSLRTCNNCRFWDRKTGFDYVNSKIAITQNARTILESRFHLSAFPPRLEYIKIRSSPELHTGFIDTSFKIGAGLKAMAGIRDLG